MVPTGCEGTPSGHNVPDVVFLLDLGEQDRDILSPRRIGLDVAVSLVLAVRFVRTDITVRASAAHRESSPARAWPDPPYFSQCLGGLYYGSRWGFGRFSASGRDGSAHRLKRHHENTHCRPVALMLRIGTSDRDDRCVQLDLRAS